MQSIVMNISKLTKFRPQLVKDVILNILKVLANFAKSHWRSLSHVSLLLAKETLFGFILIHVQIFQSLIVQLSREVNRNT